MTEKVWEKVKKKYNNEKPKRLKITEIKSNNKYYYLTLDKQWAFVKDYLVFYYQNKWTKEIKLTKIHYKKLLEIHSFRLF